MAKSDAARSAEWRRRLLLKSAIFDDLNAERAARIRQSFPGDDRPEVRAVVEFFANYPRCQRAPEIMTIERGAWVVAFGDVDDPIETAAAYVALWETTSAEVLVVAPRPPDETFKQVRDEVAEMRALGLWGRP